MTTKTMTTKIALAAAILVALAVTPAEAGGLFGKKGSKALIRGSVGKVMAPVQKRVLTPAANAACITGATAAGGYYGGAAGAAAGNAAAQAVCRRR